MNLEVISSNGVIVESVELNDTVFASKISEGSIYYALKNQLANARQGTAATKGRSDVNYSNRKPWRQKGTGRARAGSRRSPIWVGGGTVFGPQPRDYSVTLPKKIRNVAYRSLFSKKIQDKQLRVIDFNEQLLNTKTKEFYERIISFNVEKTPMIFIISDDNAQLKKVARNIPWIKVFTFNKLEIKSLLYSKLILITKDAIIKLNDFLDKEKRYAKVS